MRIFLSLLIGVCAIAAAGCGGSMSVDQDWDPDYSFDGIDAYAWLPIRATPNIGESRLKRLVGAIDAEMAKKQMTLTADDPDVLLQIHVISERRLNLGEYGATSKWATDNYNPTDLDKGWIMLDVLDAESRELVWRAVADGKVDPSSTPEEQSKKFADLTKKMLAKFPPPEK